MLALCSLALDLRPDTAGQELSRHWDRAVSRDRLGGHDQALHGGVQESENFGGEGGGPLEHKLDTISQSACSQVVGDAVYQWVPSVVPTSSIGSPGACWKCICSAQPRSETC